MKTLSFVIATLCLAPLADARLGDTAAKVVERYGQEIAVYRDIKGRTGHIYRSNGFIILVQFIDGISHSEVYAKEDDTELTESEIQAVLSANAASDKWEKIPESTIAKSGSTGWRGWVILRTGALSAYGPSTINDRRFHHAISVGTRAYNEQNKTLDRR